MFFLSFIAQARAIGTTLKPPTTILTKTTTKETPKTDGSEPYLNIRLPKNVQPVNYDLNLNVNLATTVVDGYVSISVNVTSPTKYFIIHALGYSKIESFLRDSSKTLLKVKNAFLYKLNEFFVLELYDDVPTGIYQLDFKFSYTLKKNLKGFYKSTYKTNSGVEKYV